MDASGTKRVALREFTRQSEKLSEVEFFRSERKLEELVNFARVSGHECVLEVAAGPGFVAKAFSERVAEVVATDLAPAMMRRAHSIAEDGGAMNVNCVVADADHLPFTDSAFDVVVTRYSIHHLPNPPKTLSEFRRVARSSGRVVFEDIMAPEDPHKQAYLNMVQRVHDLSHVKTHTEGELEGMLRASFKVLDKQVYAVGLDYETWIGMADTPKENAELAKRLLIDSLEGDKTGEGVELRDGTVRWTQRCARFLCTP